MVRPRAPGGADLVEKTVAESAVIPSAVTTDLPASDEPPPLI
ncbi:hypothetical protein [Leucobacter sp. GX24907]